MLSAALLFLLACDAWALSTIDEHERFAYGPNIGWMDWLNDVTHGVVVGEFTCSGYAYTPNAGWISLGNGSPADGIRYANSSATDYGVNHDGTGRLRGYAWGPEIGWLSFEDTGNPRVDLTTGRLNGHVWSPSIGWISLSNAYAGVRTSMLDPDPDADSDGIPDQWERQRTGRLDLLSPGADSDGDGVNDEDEYAADTDPTDPAGSLRILWSRTHGQAGTGLLWPGGDTRLYRIEQCDSLNGGQGWVECTTALCGRAGPGFRLCVIPPEPFPQRFYRIRAVRPLAP